MSSFLGPWEDVLLASHLVLFELSIMAFETGALCNRPASPPTAWTFLPTDASLQLHSLISH